VFIARKIAFAWLLFAAVSASAAAETNYFRVVCGKGPLTGRIWLSKWGALETLEASASLAPFPPPAPFVAALLPQGLKFAGHMILGKVQLAILNGEAFAVGGQRTLQLRDRPVQVRCRETRADEITVEVNGRPLTLERGREVAPP
jgi:hypothetical protein